MTDQTNPAEAPTPKKKTAKKQTAVEQQVAELTADLQRTRADFENYRKRAEADKVSVYQHGQSAAITKLLPVVDNIERAIAYMPAELAENKWAQGVTGLTKNLESALKGLGVTRITADEGTLFDPELHEAIQVNEEAEGETEIVESELQAGYSLAGVPIRHSMVKVTRR